MELATIAARQVALQGILIQDVMLTEFVRVSPGDTIQAVAALLQKAEKNPPVFWPVVLGKEILGVLFRHQCEAPFTNRKDRYVAETMSRTFTVVSPRDELTTILQRSSQRFELQPVAVVEQGDLVGIVTQQSINTFMEKRDLGDEQSV
jgi:predicted transcriptional regulator